MDYTRREKDIRPKNTIDILHKAMQLWRDQEADTMRELLASTGNRNNPKFDSIMQAIIGAGVANDAHAETAEKRELEAFQAGRKSEAYSPHDGSLDVYIEDE